MPFLLLLALACGPKTPTRSGPPDYFPVAEGARWTVEGRFNGRTSTETSVAVPLTVEGSRFWAFIDEPDLHEGVASTFTEMVGLGAYQVLPDEVRTADLTWLADAGQLTNADFQPMLALPPVVGAQVASRSRSPDRSGGWKVAAMESVTVPAGTFHDCARLDLGQGSEAWLCPDVGLVKWVLVTGRVEELVAWEIPGVSSGP